MMHLLLCLLVSLALAGDARWSLVAEQSVHPEVQALASALAETDVDPAVELAIARLIRAVEPTLEADIDPSLPVPEAMSVADALTAELRVERARRAWQRGELRRALDLLSPVRRDPLASALYGEAVDAWVGAERERIGTRYFALRNTDRGTREAELLAVRDALASLMEDYPESSYHGALATNLERIERELEMWN
jgi:hypothetical protein